MKELKRRHVLNFIAVSPWEGSRAFPWKALSHVFPRADAEKAFSTAHHPCRSGPGGQFAAAACNLLAITAMFNNPLECLFVPIIPPRVTATAAFPRPDAVSL